MKSNRLLTTITEKKTKNSVEDKCDIILNKCRGIDESLVIDDQGNLSKTLSVENSFQRGTMKTMKEIFESMNSLYSRMTRLIVDRINSSGIYDYPKIIRLTIRFVIMNHNNNVTNNNNYNKKSSSTVLRSQQIKIDGKYLMNECNNKKQINYLQQWFTPLIHSLVSTTNRNNIDKDINITRINIALTNFCTESIVVNNQRSTTKIVIDGKSTTNVPKTSSIFCTQNNNDQQSQNNNYDKIVNSQQNKIQNYSPSKQSQIINSYLLPLNDEDIDLDVLSQLPSDIANEIRANINSKQSLNKNISKKRVRTINDYFTPSIKK